MSNGSAQGGGGQVNIYIENAVGGIPEELVDDIAEKLTEAGEQRGVRLYASNANMAAKAA